LLASSRVLGASLLASMVLAWCKLADIHGASLIPVLISVGKFRVPGRLSGRLWIDLLLGLAQKIWTVMGVESPNSRQRKISKAPGST
jgi:hypothetical protein